MPLLIRTTEQAVRLFRANVINLSTSNKEKQAANINSNFSRSQATTMVPYVVCLCLSFWYDQL